MQEGHNNKTVILVVILILVAFFAYTFFFKGDAPSADVTVAQEATIGQEISSLLASLKKINLAGGLFDDDTFVGLTDNALEIIPFPSGRTNPFAPLGL